MPLFGVPGERIAYDVFEGPPDAPPLLLVHGFTASSASFSSNIEGLRQHFRVITCELLGHGDSESPDNPDVYAPIPAMDRIEGLLDDLGYDRVLFCGHSLGGALALRFALDRPGRVAGLIVINSNSAAGDPAWREASKPALVEMARVAREQGTGFLRETRLYPAASKRLPPEARDLLIRDFERMTPAGFAGTSEALVVDVNAWERLPELSVPTLIAIGDRDTSFLENVEQFLERLPAAHTRWITLAGAGHAANLEAAEEFNAAVAAFARDIGYLGAGRGRSSRNILNTGLTLVGSGLVAVGVGLLAAAFLVNGNSNSGGPAAPIAEFTPSPTPFEDVASERTPGPALSGPGNATPTETLESGPVQDTPTPTTEPEATEPPAEPTQVQQPVEPATPAPAPANTPVPEPTPTPIPDEEPAPEPTPTPDNQPVILVNGISQAEVGHTAVYTVTLIGDLVPGSSIAWTGCSIGMGGPGSCSITFESAGCYGVAVTAEFQHFGPRTASQAITVGDVTC
jgi:2-succinyl-6-hydroxy-2,4-cyclohexadiene-1-carboxylate synthase